MTPPQLDTEAFQRPSPPTPTLPQVSRPSQGKPAGLMVPIHPHRPWEYAGVAYVGRRAHTQGGNANILVFVDDFCKWMEVMAANS